MGNISDVERIKRLRKIDDLREEGYTDSKIAEKTGMAIEVVKRNIAYLDELKKADLTGKEIAEKRKEIYLNLQRIAEEAKDLFLECKEQHDCPLCEGKGEIPKVNPDEGNKLCPVCKGTGEVRDLFNAHKFMKEWAEANDRMAQLYGLSNIKTDIQINQQFNDNRKDQEFAPVDPEVKKRISRAIIKDHESIVGEDSA